MRLPRMLQPNIVMPVFNRLVDELERIIRSVDSGTVTLAAGTTETVVASRVVSTESVVLLTPADAAAVASQDWYVTTAEGSFTIMHASNGSARTLYYFAA